MLNNGFNVVVFFIFLFNLLNSSFFVNTYLCDWQYLKSKSDYILLDYHCMF